MKLGLTIFSTDRSMSVVDVAREAESRGFHSLYLPEHTHIPTSRTTPAPTGDAELAEEYKRTLDPFVALAAAASATETIKLGTAVSLVAQRDPIVTAKEVATLDLLSGGRVVFGVGYGWNKEEMADHGVTFRERRDLVRETMLAIKALWTEDEAGFDGEYVKFSRSWSWPKPVQKPHPPIFIGGAAGPKLFRNIAEWADGWMPIGGGGMKSAIPDLKRAFEEAGRDPGTLRILPVGTIGDRGKLDYYESLGIDEVALAVPSGTADEVFPVLDQYADLL
jgi:probable F420-dependent oxidoreductase